MFDDNGAQQQLTTSKIKIINNEMEMVCIKKTASGTPYVIISFSAYYTTNLSIARPEDVAILHYKGIVHLRWAYMCKRVDFLLFSTDNELWAKLRLHWK